MEYEEEIEKKMGHSSYAGRKDVFRLIRHIELASSNCVTGDGGDVLVSTLVFMCTMPPSRVLSFLCGVPAD